MIKRSTIRWSTKRSTNKQTKGVAVFKTPEVEGEILISKLIVVLNKIDLIPENDRQTVIIKKIEALKKVFSKTKFHDKLHFVPISANVGKL